MDFPLAGFTFAVPEEFKHAKGDIRDVDFGEIGAGSGIVIGYVGYQAKTEDKARESTLQSQSGGEKWLR